MKAYVGTTQKVKDTFFIDLEFGVGAEDKVSIFHYETGDVHIQMPLETAKKLFEQMSVELAKLLKRK